MDTMTPEQRSRCMVRIRSKDSTQEMAVRRMVHLLGGRYRLHKNNLPGTPDLVLPRRKLVIFMHGCFWHGHGCRRGSLHRKPKSNVGYWNKKLGRNMARDRRNVRKLRALGWKTVVIWECETANPAAMERKLRKALA